MRDTRADTMRWPPAWCVFLPQKDRQGMTPQFASLQCRFATHRTVGPLAGWSAGALAITGDGVEA